MLDELGPDDYECIVRKDEQGDGWIAEYPDIPGVSASGESKVSALTVAESLLSQWLSNAKALGMAVPAPGEARSASGEFKLRVPKTLHARLVRFAEQGALSLNELVSRLLTAAVARTFTDGAAAGAGFMCHRLAGSPQEPSADRDYSGVWVQRTSRILHLHLQRMADADGVSLNALALYLLAFELGGMAALAAGAPEERRHAA